LNIMRIGQFYRRCDGGLGPSAARADDDRQQTRETGLPRNDVKPRSPMLSARPTQHVVASPDPFYKTRSRVCLDMMCRVGEGRLGVPGWTG
jgi:hypothetical protein